VDAFDHSDRKRARQLLAELRAHDLIPTPWSVSSFVERVAAWRKRGIHLVGRTSEYWRTTNSKDLLTGLLVVLEKTDYIFYRLDVDARYQTHIILHELGHLLLGHTNSWVLADVVEELFDSSSINDPNSIKNILQRTTLSTQEEREAEAFADTLIMALAIPQDCARHRKILGIRE
jgi:hypothetical protein